LSVKQVAEGEGAITLSPSNMVDGKLDFRNATYISWTKYYESPEIQLSLGDTVIVKTGSTYGRVAFVQDLPMEATVNPQIAIFKTELVDKKFLFFLASSQYFHTLARNSNTGSTMPTMTQESVLSFLIALPSQKEQAQIARFLDHETARIDASIDEQQRLIELLKEKRQAVISHAVTKGLDATAPMKDSGVEWLGEVPAHWVICQSKYLLDSVTSGSRGWAEFYSDDGYLFFRIANLTRDTIDPKLDSKQFVNPPIGSEGERSKIQIDDILISITADLGSVCVANADIASGYVSQHVALVRPCRKKIFSRWLAYFVLSNACKEQLLGAGYGGTKNQLSLEDIKSFLISVPSHQEQIQIANFLDVEVSKFESLISEVVSGITFLQERRSALISAAVTGKIDVRGWQAPASPTPTLQSAEARSRK
jgi:type I restriction enzyme, S subunit